MSGPAQGALAPIDDEARDIMRDEFGRDLAESQRAAGQLPTIEQNNRMMATFFEGFEQRHQARVERAAMAPSSPAPRDEIDEAEHQRALAEEAERRGRPGLLERAKILRLGADKGDADPRAGLPPKIRVLYERMQARIDLLLTKQESGLLGEPSWHARAMAVMALRQRGASAAEVAFRLNELLTASETAFGPWNVDEAKPLIFT